MSDKECLTFIGMEYTQPITIKSDGDRFEIVKGFGFDGWMKNPEFVYSPISGIVPRHQADREKLHLILDNWLDGNGLSDQMPSEYIK